MPVETGAIFIENCLRMSKNPQVQELVSDLDRAADIGMFSESDANAALYRFQMIKKIDREVSPEFPKSFRCSVLVIWGYRQMLWEVEKLRTTRYDSNLLEHEDKLYQLWMALMPHEPLEGRISKQWQDIGFQGDDPKTDFRGMGMLGLENLIYFTQKYPRATQRFFSFSRHPKYGYTFAIVSINLTAMAYKLFKDDCAKTNIFNLFPMPDISAFHCLYSYVFYEFDKIWVESKPENMMEFSNIQQKLDKSIRSELANDVGRIFKILNLLEQL